MQGLSLVCCSNIVRDCGLCHIIPAIMIFEVAAEQLKSLPRADLSVHVFAIIY